MGRRLFPALLCSADGFGLEDFRQGQALAAPEVTATTWP